MKKLLSVVLVLAMLASMCIYLPMGVSATEAAATPETIYAEDFTDLEDGTHTLGAIADALGWKLIRGDADAEIATVADGKLSLDATAENATDIVFEVAHDERLKANHTFQYDMTKSFTSGNLSFAGMYTGNDNGETVKAIINKTTYENYNQTALVDGVINELNQRAAAYKIGGGSYDQCRPENIPGGGDSNTWKVVFDVTNNQVDAYAAGARINSNLGSMNDSAAAWAEVNVADYVGEGAYIRVQKTGSATFDNISIVAGGTAVSYGDYAYAQDFSNIPDGTYTGAQLAALTGFQTMLDSTSTASMVYKIANGRLEIVANGECTNSYTFKSNQQFATLFVPEMETAQDAVVIEYDMTYLYDKDVTGSANSGDTPLGIEMYGRRSDFHAFWQFTPKGFPMYGFYKGSHTVDGAKYSLTQAGSTADKGYYYQSQGRWEDTSFNSKAGTYVFSNGSYGNTLTGSTEHIKVVLSITDGMFIFVNGVCAIQLSETALAAWTSTLGGGNASHIIGNLLRFRVPAGCHVALDNIKITTDPAPIAGPDLWLTEASCGVEIFNNTSKFSGSEYVEVYNASNKAINIYDYALTQRAYNNSLDNVGTAIGLRDITLMYPGTHTFKSIKLAEDGVTPLYTYDVTNPAYADGWLQPGEVAVLWNKTDSMHNGAETGPSVITDATAANYGMGNFGHKTVADFRAALTIPETTKVFQMYNDYNRAFNNSGSHFVALVDRDLVQPGYNPATGTGDETLTAAAIGFADYASTILDVTADTNSGRTVKTVTYASYDVNEAYGYTSVVFGRPDSALTAADMTPGYLKDSQKKAFTITMDDNAYEGYLGEEFNYLRNDGYYKMLFATVDGELVTENFKIENVTKDVVIDRLYVAMTTVPGVGIRFGGTNETNLDETGDESAAGLRWVTAIKDYHVDELIENEFIADVKIGTLVARSADVAAADLTLEKTTDKGGQVRDVVAFNDVWYADGADDYNGYKLFAGGVKNMFGSNYDKNYIGVGYVSVTLTNGEVITVYGDYTEANENNVIDIIDAVYADENNGLTEDELAVLDAYLIQYDDFYA